MNDERKRVFADTSAIRHSIPGADARATGGELQLEIALLRKIADLAKVGTIELLWNAEVTVELLGQLKIGGPRPAILEAGATRVPSPVHFSRTLSPPSLLDNDWARWQIRCLRQLQHPRYLQMQRALGAHDPRAKNADNQLIDAYYVWCADAAGATHLLSTDFKLCNLARRARIDLRVAVVRPSELLAEIEDAA